MPTDRQTIMETNRSLRNIKNELENLLEKGVIDEAYYDRIHENLPEESPLAGPLRTKTADGAPIPVASPVASPPVNAMSNLDIARDASPAPPSYNATPAPSLPQRNATPSTPAKPILAHTRALYRYAASDARDVSFEKDDKVLVHEYMNADWWMGQNTRTGKEGIFPRNYVLIETENKVQHGYPQQPSFANQQGGPPPQQNPYDANVPPMAVSEGGQPSAPGEPSKTSQYGKKFGKKMGNAAIFGAGATIGGNIVNSIF